MGTDFESYIRGSEPDKKEKASAWKTAIGVKSSSTHIMYMQSNAPNVSGSI